MELWEYSYIKAGQMLQLFQLLGGRDRLDRRNIIIMLWVQWEFLFSNVNWTWWRIILISKVGLHQIYAHKYMCTYIWMHHMWENAYTAHIYQQANKDILTQTKPLEFNIHSKAQECPRAIRHILRVQPISVSAFSQQ